VINGSRRKSGDESAGFLDLNALEVEVVAMACCGLGDTPKALLTANKGDEINKNNVVNFMMGDELSEW
jgi:hypothetical protein